MPLENLQELSAWIGTNTSQIYSVYVYPRAVLSEAQLALEDTQEFVNPDSFMQAYMEVVEARTYTACPAYTRWTLMVTCRTRRRRSSEDYLFVSQ